MTSINQYQFFLDSKYRSGGGNPDPKFILKQPLTLSNSMHYFTCRVISCEIPFSFKAINTTNNILQVNYNYDSGVHNTTGNITITAGNYTILTLLQELKDQLLIFIKAIEPVHYPDFNFVYDRDSGKVTLNMTRRSGQETRLILYWALNDILGEFFGFNGTLNTTLEYLNGGVILSINNTSQIHVNCSPASCIMIRSDSLAQPITNEEFLVEFDQSVSDILFKCLINTQFNSWIIQQNTENYEIRLTNKIIDVISLYLTTLTYDVINLDGVHWRTHIMIEEKRPEILDKIDQLALDNENKIKELEDQRIGLLGELKNLNDGLKTDILQTIKPDVNALNSDTKNIEKMKEEFVQEIEQNRKNNLN